MPKSFFSFPLIVILCMTLSFNVSCASETQEAAIEMSDDAFTAEAGNFIQVLRDAVVALGIAIVAEVLVAAWIITVPTALYLETDLPEKNWTTLQQLAFIQHVWMTQPHAVYQAFAEQATLILQTFLANASAALNPPMLDTVLAASVDTSGYETPENLTVDYFVSLGITEPNVCLSTCITDDGRLAGFRQDVAPEDRFRAAYGLGVGPTLDIAHAMSRVQLVLAVAAGSGYSRIRQAAATTIDILVRMATIENNYTGLSQRLAEQGTLGGFRSSVSQCPHIQTECFSPSSN
ncbi:MAG: hypothetical protein IPJ88_04615 [Myxococcales bacterium]|nr:MAG: hypothetical protein IPJ88_04615 [Myxococcales bacterium]